MDSVRVTRDEVLADPDWAAEKINFLRERLVSLEKALGAADPGDHEKRITMELPVGRARGPRLRVE